jgi:hypothetical protein
MLAGQRVPDLDGEIVGRVPRRPLRPMRASGLHRFRR